MPATHTETAMASALSRAGMNTSEFRLRQAAHDALAKHHGNVERALPTFKKLIDYSGKNELVDAALLFVLKELSDDRQTNGDGRGQTSYGDHTAPAAPSSRGGAALGEHGNHSTVGRPVREPSAAQTAADLAVKTRSALNAFDRELTRTGQRWGNVSYSELSNMTEDGDIAIAIRQHIGSLRGTQALKPIRDLMTPREFAILINKTRKGSN